MDYPIYNHVYTVASIPASPPHAYMHSLWGPKVIRRGESLGRKLYILTIITLQLGGSGTTSFSDCIFNSWEHDKKVHVIIHVAFVYTHVHAYIYVAHSIWLVVNKIW